MVQPTGSRPKPAPSTKAMPAISGGMPKTSDGDDEGGDGGRRAGLRRQPAARHQQPEQHQHRQGGEKRWTAERRRELVGQRIEALMIGGPKHERFLVARMRGVARFYRRKRRCDRSRCPGLALRGCPTGPIAKIPSKKLAKSRRDMMEYRDCFRTICPDPLVSRRDSHVSRCDSALGSVRQHAAAHESRKRKSPSAAPTRSGFKRGRPPGHRDAGLAGSGK